MDEALPRNFKLLEELDNCSKYNGISYGLENAEDSSLTYWTAMVINKSGIMTTLNIECTNEYPLSPPLVCLNYTESNKVKKIFDLNKSSKPLMKSEVIKNWTPQSSMNDILLEIQSLN